MRPPFMKALPVKSINDNYIEEATHVIIKIPGPSGQLILPILLKGTREGTRCWSWNGDTDKPTLRPSVLHTSGHYTDSESPCWCSYNREHPDEKVVFTCFRCHSWVNDGQAIFLSDSTHEFKGQTLDLLEVIPPSMMD
jgi:hypothetical protein